MYYVYILTNRANKVLYTGVTNNLERRVGQHEEGVAPRSFTAKYKVHKLVYCEESPDVIAAIQREKEIKGWSHQKKVKLIEELNPRWADLFDANCE